MNNTIFIIKQNHDKYINDLEEKYEKKINKFSIINDEILNKENINNINYNDQIKDLSENNSKYLNNNKTIEEK